MRQAFALALAFTTSLLGACARPVDVPPTGGGEGEGEGEGERIPLEGEGEGNPNEGEGEGNPNEGEGEGNPNEGEGEGDTGGEGEGDIGGEGEGEGEGVDLDEVAEQVLTSSARPGRIVDDALRLAWQVVVSAVQLDGNTRLITSGTLDLRGNNESYSETPANALVYLDDGDIDVRFVIATFDGDFTTPRDPGGFYARPHDVVLTSVVSGDDDITCESHLRNSTGTRAGSGTTSEGLTFDMGSTVTITADFGQNTVDYISSEVRSGRVRGAGGLDLAYADTARYRVFVGDSIAEDLVNEFVVSGSAGGSTWSLQNGLVQRTFRDGRAVEEDFWAASEGDLQRNGAAFGVVGARASPDLLQIVLVTPGNVIQVLESHAR